MIDIMDQLSPVILESFASVAVSDAVSRKIFISARTGQSCMNQIRHRWRVQPDQDSVHCSLFHIKHLQVSSMRRSGVTLAAQSVHPTAS